MLACVKFYKGEAWEGLIHG